MSQFEMGKENFTIDKFDTKSGRIKIFCRTKGHGYITPNEQPNEDIYVHISDIEGAYIPLPGDEVRYRLSPMPPKFEKFQAVLVHIINWTPAVHAKWTMPSPLVDPHNLKQTKF